MKSPGRSAHSSTSRASSWSGCCRWSPASRPTSVFDLECFPPHAPAAGEGGDEADALLALWTTLTGQHHSADAMAHVAEAYRRRTAQLPEPVEDGSPGQVP